MCLYYVHLAYISTEGYLLPLPGSQRTGGPQYNQGIYHALSTIVKEHGIRGLYKGNGANCVRVIPVYALKFSLNDKFKEMMLVWRIEGGDDPQLSFLEKMAAGSMAGTVQILATYPLDIIRTRLQLAEIAGSSYKGIADCAMTTIRHEGLLGLYKGLFPSMLAGVPYVGLQMTFYDMLKTAWGPYLPRREDGSIGVVGMLACGSVAGLTAQTLSFPSDTVRHRMQANGINGTTKVYVNTMDCFQKIYTKEGVGGFFKGWGLNVLRALPGAERSPQGTTPPAPPWRLGMPMSNEGVCSTLTGIC
eukprot:gene4517-5533_t